MTAIHASVEAIRSRALTALSTVIDPELDEPLTDLGFVADVRVDGDEVTAVLRLPTAMCSPNFAFLMASDSADALTAELPANAIRVVLDGNTDSDRINASVAAGLGFADAYPDETAEDLAALRRTFQVKAHLAALERLAGRLLKDGETTQDSLVNLRLQDVPPIAELRALERRRAVLGLPETPDARVLVDADGEPWDIDDIATQLRLARLTRISIDGNAHFCRGLLRTRYGEGPVSETPTGRLQAKGRPLLPLVTTDTSRELSRDA